MRASKSDRFLMSSWVKLLFVAVIMYICSAVVPMAATYEGLGFPCYFNNLVNYSALNLTVRNSAKHLTPTLFLEKPEMLVYIFWTFIVDGIAIIYYCLAAVAVYRAKHVHATTMMSMQSWIALLGSHSVLYVAILRMWSMQLFIHVLSYKHVLMAAFVYCIHFCISFAHIQSLITCNSAQWEIPLLEQHVPDNTMMESLLTRWKPVCVNLYLSTTALEMLLFSLSTMMAVGNSFYVLVSDAIFGAVNMFLALTVVWYINTEFFLVKFMRRQVGFYVGVFVGYLILLLPVIRYENAFVQANLHYIVAINISCIPILCILAIVIRVIRSDWGLCTPSAAYMPLATSAPTVDRTPTVHQKPPPLPAKTRARAKVKDISTPAPRTQYQSDHESDSEIDETQMIFI